MKTEASRKPVPMEKDLLKFSEAGVQSVEIGKPLSEAGTQLAQEIDPHERGQSSGIAAGQDPYFE